MKTGIRTVLCYALVLALIGTYGLVKGATHIKQYHLQQLQETQP